MKRKHNSGIILVSVLWIIIILSMLAVGLGRHSSVELSLTKHSMGSVKAYYNAKAGIIYALSLIEQDSDDDEFQDFDNLYAMGVVHTDTFLPEEFLDNVPVGEHGHFDIGYSSRDYDGEGLSHHLGLMDEERRINLNAIDEINYKVMSELIMIVDEEIIVEEADELAANIVDWHDDNENATADLGNESGVKNEPYDSVDELFLVEGMTQSLFDRLKDYVTVYPKTPAEGLKINLMTAPPNVIRALAKGISPNTEAEIVDGMAEGINEYRKGDDGEMFTDDDPQTLSRTEIQSFFGGVPESVLFGNVNDYHKAASNFLRVQSIGVDEHSSAKSYVQAIVERDELKIIDWYRN